MLDFVNTGVFQTNDGTIAATGICGVQREYAEAQLRALKISGPGVDLDNVDCPAFGVLLDYHLEHAKLFIPAGRPLSGEGGVVVQATPEQSEFIRLTRLARGLSLGFTGLQSASLRGTNPFRCGRDFGYVSALSARGGSSPTITDGNSVPHRRSVKRSRRTPAADRATGPKNSANITKTHETAEYQNQEIVFARCNAQISSASPTGCRRRSPAHNNSSNLRFHVTRRPNVQEFITSITVARIFNVAPDTVRLWARLGKLHAVATTPSGIRLFLREEMRSPLLAR